MAVRPDAADLAIKFAVAQVGKPYVWGSIGPNSFDCSGLIMRAYQLGGVYLPRTTFLMVNVGQHVTEAQLLPGDLIFPHIGHVQLYIGGGKQCEAYDTGYPIRVAPVTKVWQARRVAPPGRGTGGGTTSNSGSPQAATPGAASLALPGVSQIAGLGHVISWIINPHNWLRVAMFVAGVALMFAGLAKATTIGKAI